MVEGLSNDELVEEANLESANLDSAGLEPANLVASDQEASNLDASDQAAATLPPDSIRNRRLRSPRGHGEFLQVPQLDAVSEIWSENRSLVAQPVSIGNLPLGQLQELGRRELIELARQYTRQYSDVDLNDRIDDSAQRRSSESKQATPSIVMAGHQPELFHPGVWYKNFVLSQIGSQLNAVAINLVVDNDVCTNTSIRYPKLERGPRHSDVSLATIPIVPPGPNVPFESRVVKDIPFFQGFAARVSTAMSGWVEHPLVERLWPHVMASMDELSHDDGPRLGAVIAAGRHRLENEIGLKTWEVPISLLAGSQSFGHFFHAIVTDLKRFQAAYNNSLLEYRSIHGIRSHSHPVPELEESKGWYEVPFWVWQTTNPRRRRLFANITNGRTHLTDRAGWKTEIGNGPDALADLNRKGIAIRPRALMTTMFSRLVLSDLFIHGIGGAKYDQLTDVITQRFFGSPMPTYLTLTATMKLPTEATIVRRNDVTKINQRIRNLKYHPETEIQNPDAQTQALIEEKRDWTIGDHRGERSKRKHEAITDLNRQLQSRADISTSQLLATRDQIKSQLRSSEILDSREYSFCLFPESLIDQLQAGS